MRAEEEGHGDVRRTAFIPELREHAAALRVNSALDVLPAADLLGVILSRCARPSAACNRIRGRFGDDESSSGAR